MTINANLDNIVASKVLAMALRSGRIAHAYLFRGPAGSPKSDFAYEFAAGLLCDSVSDEGERCGACYSCREVIKRSHPDLYVIEKEGTAIRIKRSHEILKEAISRPFHSGRKVFIIEDAEEMTAEASNALLKLIEEPPPYVVFVLTTGNASAIPETIISRCQVVPFKQASGDDENLGTLVERTQKGEALLREVLDRSPVEEAVKYAKSEIAERLNLVFLLNTAIYTRMNRRIQSDPDRYWSADEDTLSDYKALKSLLRAKDRLQRSVNAFLTFSALFMELKRGTSNVFSGRG